MIGPTAAALATVLALAPSVPTPPPPIPSSDTAPQMSERERRSNRRLAIAGGVMFGVFYVAITGVAASELDATRGEEDSPAVRDRRRVAHLSFVPVAGPIVASPLGPRKGDRAALVAYGAFQAIGLAMITVASVNLARDRRRHRMQLSVTGGAAPTGGGLALRGRF